jgi:hypothetical protein
MWLITANDNIRAIRFYQICGMDLCVFYRHGAPLKEGEACAAGTRGRRYPELEFEMLLDDTVRSGVVVWRGI